MFLKETEEQRSTVVTIFQKWPLFPSFFNKTLGEGAEEWCTRLQEHYRLHSPVLCGCFIFPSLQQKKILSLLGQLDSASTEKKKSETAAISRNSRSLFQRFYAAFSLPITLLENGEKNSE